MRVELTAFSRNIDFLVNTIERNNFSAVHLTNKDTHENNLAALSVLTSTFPSVHFCAHYSIKYQYKRKAEISAHWLVQYTQKLIDMGVDSLLLMSGVPRRTFDVLAGLQILKDHNLLSNIDVYVVYNPFLAGDELEQENERLIQKLRFAELKGVFLQIGLNAAAATAGIERIRKNRPHIPIFASVLVPSHHFSQRFQFRPWKGVHLPNSFLQASLAGQIKIAQNMAEFYTSNGVDILAEMFPFDEELWQQFASSGTHLS